MELTGQRGADVAFEVIGLGQTIEQTINMTRRGGQAILVGVPKMDVMVNVPAFFGVVLMEKTIKGSWYGSSNVQTDVPEAGPPLLGGPAQARRAGVAHDHARRGERRLRRHGAGRGRPLGDRLLARGRSLQPCDSDDLGSSELIVSEVGFGTWTIATDWWGRVDDKAGLVNAALDAGMTFFDTAPVYGDAGFGETIVADILGKRDDVVITTKCGYDIDAPRIAPGHSERPQDWRPASVRAR